MRARLAAVAVVVLALAGAAQASTPLTGVRGVVLRGPTRPVCELGVPCEAPAPGVTLVFSRPGAAVRAVTTTRDGSFTLVLPPGSYAVRSTRKFLGSGVTPTLALVRVGRLTRIVFHVDTGIR